MNKRILSLLVAVFMLFSLLPMAAFADESIEPEEEPTPAEEIVEETAEETTVETAEETTVETAEETTEETTEETAEETTEETVEETAEETVEETTDETAEEESTAESEPPALDGGGVEEWAVTLNDAKPGANPLLYTFSWEVTVPDSANAGMSLQWKISGYEYMTRISYSRIYGSTYSYEVPLNPGNTVYFRVVLEDYDTGDFYYSEEKSVTVPAPEATEGECDVTYEVKAGEIYHFSLSWGLYILNASDDKLDAYKMSSYGNLGLLDDCSVKGKLSAIRIYDTSDVYIYAREDADFCLGSLENADVPKLDCGESTLTEVVYRFTAEETGLYRLTTDSDVQITQYDGNGYQQRYNVTGWPFSLEAEHSCFFYVQGRDSSVKVSLKKITPDDANKLTLDTQTAAQAGQLYVFTAPETSVYYLDMLAMEAVSVYRENGENCGNRFSLEKGEIVYMFPVYLEEDDVILVRDFQTAPKTTVTPGRNTGLKGTLFEFEAPARGSYLIFGDHYVEMTLDNWETCYAPQVLLQKGQKLWLRAEDANPVTVLTIVDVNSIDTQAKPLTPGVTTTVEPGVLYRFEGAEDTYYNVEFANCWAYAYNPDRGYSGTITKGACQLDGIRYFYVHSLEEGTPTLKVSELTASEYTTLELDKAITINGRTACTYTAKESGLYVLMNEDYGLPAWPECSCMVESSTGNRTPILRLTEGQTMRFLVNDYETEFVLKQLSTSNTTELALGTEANGGNSKIYSFKAQTAGYYRVLYTYDYPEYGGGPSASGAIRADSDEEPSVYWYMDEGETVFFYGAEVETVRVVKSNAPQTIVPEQKASGSGAFDISLSAGNYFIQADNDCLLTVYRSGVWYGRTQANSVMYFEQAGEYRFIPDEAVVDLCVADVMDAGLQTLKEGTTETVEIQGNEAYFRFTAEKAGHYLIRHTALNAVYYQRDVDYGWFCEDGTIVALNAGDELVICVFDYTIDSAETWECEICVSNMSTASVTPISAGETKTVKGDTFFSFKAQESGFYVAESSDGTFRCVTTGNSFGTSDLLYFAATEGEQIYFDFSADSGSAGFSLRKATDKDMPQITCGTTNSGGCYYRFTSTEAGAYRVVSGDFCEICDAHGAQITASYYDSAYFYMNADETVYIASDDDFSVEKYDIPTLTPGQPQEINAVQTLFTFTASADGIYIIHASNEEYFADTYIYIVDEEDYSGYWDGASAYLPVEMKAGQKITLLVECYSEAGANVQVDKLEDVRAGNLTLGETKKTGGDEELWCFVPSQDGLYVVSVSDMVCVNNGGGFSGEQLSKDSKCLLSLVKGEPCYFLAENSGTTLTVQTLAEHGTEKLSDRATATESTVYSFKVPDSGLYTVSASGCEVSLHTSAYESQTLIYGNGNKIVSLAKGETVYFLVTPYGTDGSVSIARTDMSGYTKLSLNESLTIVKEADLCFTAPEDGEYVVLPSGNAYAPVMVDGSGKSTLGASVGCPVLVTLQKGQQILIQVNFFGLSMGVDSTIRVVRLGDYGKVTMVSGGETKNLTAGQFYCFTAKESGKYTIRLSKGSGDYAWGCVFDRTSDSWGLESNANEESAVVITMQANESVYICVGSGSAASAVLTIERSGDTVDPPMEPMEPTEVTETLGDLAADSSKSDAEKRKAIQEIGSQNLIKALEEDKNAVKNLKALEENTASVVVDASAASVISESNVSIVGATLNNVTGDVTLTIRAADDTVVEDITMPDEVADDEDKIVHLELELDGVEDSTNLAVPVCITIEVPENIQWELVRLVHHGKNGPEVLVPTVYVENNVRYARFVVGGFSPFTLTEAAHMAGDVNGSGGTDIMDVLALLKFVAGIDSSIIYGDVDNNGKTDIMDVLALLKSVAGITGTEIY